MTLPTIEILLQREYLMVIRDALLKQVDAYERLLGITPRTAELRKAAKGQPCELDYNKDVKKEGE